MKSLAWPARYALLDGFRGLAALLVVMHHVGIVELGHYAVMIFFVISGYCITASADACLRRGLSFSSFMARRIRRIYPPYLLAIAFFAVTRIVKFASGDHSGMHHTITDWLQNLTLTQWLTIASHPVAEPAQNPTLLVSAFWSLNYEEQFYLVTALLLLLANRVKLPMIAPMAGLALIGLAWNLAFPDGWVCGLFLEYWLHFSLGAGIFFVLCRYPQQRYRGMFLLATLLLACASLYGVMSGSSIASSPERVYAELSVVSVFTLGLLLLRPYSEGISRSLWWKPAAALGSISYSLYLVHQFNLSLVTALTNHLLPIQSPQVLRVSLMLMLHIGIATLFWRWCERPFLTRGLKYDPPALGAALQRP